MQLPFENFAESEADFAVREETSPVVQVNLNGEQEIFSTQASNVKGHTVGSRRQKRSRDLRANITNPGKENDW